MNFIKRFWKLLILVLLVSAGCFFWYQIQHEQPNHILKVAFLNIGQGDAIYIESPTHNQIIIDGGPGNAILGELTKVMPFYDHSIDALLITNPDADHYAGFIDVLKSFSVGTVFEPGTHSPTQTYATFEKDIQDKHIPKIIARRGMIIHLGGGADLKILFPDQDVSTWATNDGSIIAQLTYGSTSVMFTGDAPSKAEEYVLSLDGKNVQSTILKEGHHGSKTSDSEPFITAVNPQYDVISAGFHNRYGLPSQETLDLLNKLKIPTLITYETGTIIATSNGTSFSIKTEK